MSQGDVRDRRTFYLYTIVVTALTAVIAFMFFDMWTSGGHDLLSGLTTAIPFIPDGIAGIQAVVLFLFGLSMTWLGLFAHDYRKRYQGALLLIGTLIILVVMTVLGRGVQNIDPTLANLGSFLVGVALGILSEGIEIETEEDNGKFQGNLRDIDFGESMFLRAMLTNGDYAKFPIASLGLIYLVQGLVVIGNLLNIVFNGLNAPIMTFAYIVGSGVFLFFFDKFINIDVPPSERDFEVLGPEQSGKTYFALGLYRTVLEHPEKYEQKNVDKAMLDLYDEYNEGRKEQDPPLSWKIIAATVRQTFQIRFSFLTKRRFPTLVNAEMRDHPGEVLGSIGNLFESDDFDRDTDNHLTSTDGGRDVGDDEDDSDLEWWEESAADDDNDDDEEDQAASNKEADALHGDGESEDGDESSNYADYVADEDGSNASVSLDEDSFEVGFPDEDDQPQEIEDISGVGPAKADALREAGYESITDIKATSQADLSEISGIANALAARIKAGVGDFEVSEETDVEVEEETEDAEADAEVGSPDEDDKDDKEVELSDEDDKDDKEVELSDEDVERNEKVAFPSEDDKDDKVVEPSNEDDNSVGGKRLRDKIAEEMHERIQESDKLVFLLDSERFYGRDPTGSSGGGVSMEETAMVHIANNANVDEIILVASKADFFIDDWQENRGHRSQPKDSPTKFQDFREYVERRFENEAGVEPLTAKANTSIIHPVYFATEEVEGEPLLKTNDSGHIIPIGFEAVLDELAQ